MPDQDIITFLVQVGKLSRKQQAKVSQYFLLLVPIDLSSHIFLITS
jgi:hypothetical protein